MAVARSTESSPSSRPLSAADWVQAAMAAIVEGGVAAVAVEPLALRLGATKGSFYHHFANRDALIAAALDDWERSQTEAVIERLELIADPGARLRAVTAAALADRAGGMRDAALVASAGHPQVGPVVKRVTARRLGYLTEMYVALGFSTPAAGRRALLLYTSYLGLFGYLRAGLGDEDGEAERRAYADELLTALVPTSPARGRRPRDA
jgi:AcrR family transcriptional regulator